MHLEIWDFSMRPNKTRSCLVAELIFWLINDVHMQIYFRGDFCQIIIVCIFNYVESLVYLVVGIQLGPFENKQCDFYKLLLLDTFC